MITGLAGSSPAPTKCKTGTGITIVLTHRNLDWLRIGCGPIFPTVASYDDVFIQAHKYLIIKNSLSIRYRGIYSTTHICLVRVQHGYKSDSTLLGKQSILRTKKLEIKKRP